ncbi:MAG TPA: SH3 domain-containing protein [Thermomicrobiales bacterium]
MLVRLPGIRPSLPTRAGVGKRRGGFRRFGRYGAVALILAITIVGFSPQPVHGESPGYIATDALNLREGPGTWAPVINVMWQGEPVTILDGPTADGWYQVSYYGQVGWAYGDYLGFGSGGGAGGMGGTAWVNTDALNIRADASKKAAVIGLLYQGEEVQVTGGEVNGFVPVSANGVWGWVWSGYLSWDGPVSSGPEHWIDVDRSSRTVTLYVGDEPIATYYASLGFDPSPDGFYSTAIGTYYVYSKYEPISYTPWADAYIKYWVGFDPERLNGFHSWTLDANGNVLPWGDGPTGGCVATDMAAAKAIYDFSYIGMRVEIHD